MDKDFIERVVAYADRHKFPDAPTPMNVVGLSLARARTPSTLKSTLYKPLLCLVLQGEKQTRFAEKAVTFRAGDALIVSIDIPTVSQVTVASGEHPYVSLAVDVDIATIRGLQSQMDLDELDLHSQDTVQDFAIASGVSGSALASAVQRLFDLHDRPRAEQTVMTPLLLREIHFRILSEDHAGMLRRLARPDSHESRINKAIVKLQKDYAAPMAVAELATLAGMSVSSFHEHFKAVTATTPLQYLKNLRLLVAQQRLAINIEQVSKVAFEVGYESVAQFSRDYARKYGYPPSLERQTLSGP